MRRPKHPTKTKRRQTQSGALIIQRNRISSMVSKRAREHWTRYVREMRDFEAAERSNTSYKHFNFNFFHIVPIYYMTRIFSYQVLEKVKAVIQTYGTTTRFITYHTHAHAHAHTGGRESMSATCLRPSVSFVCKARTIFPMPSTRGSR
jgi:adenine-specific DNA glycosylase